MGLSTLQGVHLGRDSGRHAAECDLVFLQVMDGGFVRRKIRNFVIALAFSFVVFVFSALVSQGYILAGSSRMWLAVPLVGIPLFLVFAAVDLFRALRYWKARWEIRLCAGGDLLFNNKCISKYELHASKVLIRDTSYFPPRCRSVNAIYASFDGRKILLMTSDDPVQLEDWAKKMRLSPHWCDGEEHVVQGVL